MDVVVWALWIWIALSAVALVVYVFRRVRYNRRKRAAVLENTPLPINPDAAKSKAKKSAEPKKQAGPLAQRTPKRSKTPKTEPVPTKPAAKEAKTARISSTANTPAETAAAKPKTLLSGAGKPKTIKPKTIKAETEAEPTGPPLIFENSTAATSKQAEPTSAEPKSATSKQAEPETAPAVEDKGKSEAKSSNGVSSVSALLAPRPNTSAADKTEAVDNAEPADKTDAADESAGADITLPADEKPDLDLARPSTSSPTKTLADVLAGIRLPYDLFPVDEPNPQVADVAVTLVTMTTPASQVGMAIADELERLGYEIFSLSDSEAVAKRGTDATGNPEDLLSMVIRTDVGPEGQPIDSADADESLPSAVAVDIWVGGGESPLQTPRRTSLGI